jgi:hypothetical protein
MIKRGENDGMQNAGQVEKEILFTTELKTYGVFGVTGGTAVAMSQNHLHAYDNTVLRLANIRSPLMYLAQLEAPIHFLYSTMRPSEPEMVAGSGTLSSLKMVPLVHPICVSHKRQSRMRTNPLKRAVVAVQRHLCVVRGFDENRRNT